MRAAELELTEKQFQQQVLALAGVLGWWSYHTHDSRSSQQGFPDLVLVKAPRVLFVELKSTKGRVRRDQEFVLGLLVACPGVETYLWRPVHWPVIEDVLQGRASAVAL